MWHTSDVNHGVVVLQEVGEGLVADSNASGAARVGCYGFWQFAHQWNMPECSEGPDREPMTRGQRLPFGGDRLVVVILYEALDRNTIEVAARNGHALREIVGRLEDGIGNGDCRLHALNMTEHDRRVASLLSRSLPPPPHVASMCFNPGKISRRAQRR